MNSIQIAILALGLALNSFMNFFTSGQSLNSTDFDQKLQAGTIILLSQILMLGAGLWLGIRIGVLAENSNYLFSVGLLSFIALKIIFESIRNKADVGSNLLEKRELIIFTFSEGIIPLLLGISVGLVVDYLMTAWFILIIFQSIALVSGFYLSSHRLTLTLKFRLEIIGGLVILAAALKMLISLIGY